MSAKRDADCTARELRAQAAAWLAKLHGSERTPQLEADFHSWIQLDPAHAWAFEQITDIWDSITPTTTAGLPREAMDPTVLNAVAIHPRRRVKLAFAACAAAVLAAVSFLWLLGAGESYRTAVGEERTITLTDGSRLTLNSDTSLEVSLRKTQRQVTLSYGEAYFEIAHDPSRPFIVAAGHRTVTAFGTTFLVRYDPQITEITLVDGKITVARTTGKGLSLLGARKQDVPAGKFTLIPGERLRIASEGPPMLDRPRPETTAAWRRGEVILDATPLESAAADLNRYQRERLVIDDPRIAQQPVSGVYRTGDALGFAQAVARLYDLQVVSTNDRIHLRTRNSSVQ